MGQPLISPISTPPPPPPQKTTRPCPQVPTSMDCAGSHVILAFEPLRLQLLRFDAARGRLSPLREVAVPGPGRPLLSLALVPPQEPGLSDASGAAAAAAPGPTQRTSVAGEGGGSAAVPRQAVLLRWGGALSVLELEGGSELLLSNEVRGVPSPAGVSAEQGPGAREQEQRLKHAPSPGEGSQR
jgi:hypothetical protein